MRCANSILFEVDNSGGSGIGSCVIRCHPSCASTKCSVANDASKCTECKDTTNFELTTPGQPSTCRRICHDSCAPGQCTVSKDMNKCTTCKDSTLFEIDNGAGPGVGLCVTKCHPTCHLGRCSVANDATKCTDCKDTDNFEITDINNPSPCRRICHSSCATGMCSESKDATKCTACKDSTLFEVDNTGGSGIGSCVNKCHSSCALGQCSVANDASKCTTCKDTTNFELTTPGQPSTCRRICHDSCAPGQCSFSNDASKCTLCKNPQEFELSISGQPSTCRRICHTSCAPGQCSESHNANKCLRCASQFKKVEIQDRATGAGPCVDSCYETCGTCSAPSANDKCLTCRNLRGKGELTLLQGQCLCQEGTYYVEGQFKCATCHNSCSACSGPKPTQCTICKDGKRLEKAQGSTSEGSCVDFYDTTTGKVKEEFKDQVETSTVDTQKNPELLVLTRENFQPARTQSRLPKAGNKRKIARSVSPKLKAAIERYSSLPSFSLKGLMPCKVEGLDEGTGYSYRVFLTQDGTSLDYSFEIIDKKQLFVIADCSISDPYYFFKHLREVIQQGSGSTNNRLLQALSAENQKLVDNTPILSNETFSAKFLAHDYDEKAVDIMEFLGVALRISSYVIVLAAFLVSLVLAFKSKAFMVTKFLELMFVVQWMTKIAYIPAAWSIYELVFMDELAKADTSLMMDVARETGVRKRIDTKSPFFDYSVPVMVLNSGAIYLCLILAYMVILVLIKLVYLVKNKYYQKEETGVIDIKPKRVNSLEFDLAGNKQKEDRENARRSQRNRRGLSMNRMNSRSKNRFQSIGSRGNLQQQIPDEEQQSPKSKKSSERNLSPPKQQEPTSVDLPRSNQSPQSRQSSVVVIRDVLPDQKNNKNNKNNFNNNKGVSRSTQVVKVCLSLVTPSLVFYALLNTFWISFASNPEKGWVFMSFGISLIILGTAATLYFVAVWCAFSKKQQKQPSQNSAENDSKNNKKSGNRSQSSNNNINIHNRASQDYACVRDQSSGSLLSILRFVLMMAVLITLQNHRVTTLSLLFCLQGGFCIIYLVVLLTKGLKYSVAQIVFEVCLILLVSAVFMTEVPQNRVDEDKLLNRLLPLSIALLAFSVMIAKATEFAMWVYGLVRPGDRSTKVEDDKKDKKNKTQKRKRKFKAEDTFKEKESNPLKSNQEKKVRRGENNRNRAERNNIQGFYM